MDNNKKNKEMDFDIIENEKTVSDKINKLNKKVAELEAEKSEINKGFQLPNKKVKIKLVESRSNTFHKDPNQATLLTNASVSFKVPTNQFGNIVNPLTKEEREYLEAELGIDLNPNIDPKLTNKTNFWTTKKARVKLRKSGKKLESATLELDLSKPYEYIQYKIAKVSPKVANEWAKRYDSGEYQFVIVDGDVEAEEELKYINISDEVLEYLLSIKNNKKKLFDLIRLYGSSSIGKAITYKNSASKMYTELRKLQASPKDIKNLHFIIKQGDEGIANKVFLEDAITCGIVERRGSEFIMKGGHSIGFDEHAAISFLTKPVNQSIKLQIQGAIEKFYTENE